MSIKLSQQKIYDLEQCGFDLRAISEEIKEDYGEEDLSERIMKISKKIEVILTELK